MIKKIADYIENNMNSKSKLESNNVADSIATYTSHRINIKDDVAYEASLGLERFMLNTCPVNSVTISKSPGDKENPYNVQYILRYDDKDRRFHYLSIHMWVIMDRSEKGKS